MMSSISCIRLPTALICIHTTFCHVDSPLHWSPCSSTHHIPTLCNLATASMVQSTAVHRGPEGEVGEASQEWEGL